MHLFLLASSGLMRNGPKVLSLYYLSYPFDRFVFHFNGSKFGHQVALLSLVVNLVNSWHFLYKSTHLPSEDFRDVVSFASWFLRISFLFLLTISLRPSLVQLLVSGIRWCKNAGFTWLYILHLEIWFVRRRYSYQVFVDARMLGTLSWPPSHIFCPG